MRKSLWIAYILIIFFCLAACGEAADAAPTTDPTPAATPAPIAAPTPTPIPTPTPAPEPIRAELLVAGDIVMHEGMNEQALSDGGGSYDYAPLFEDVRALIEGADYASWVLDLLTPAFLFQLLALAALGIAAHETGHALQHARKYVPLTFRNMMVFPTMVTSKLAIPIIILGIILTSFIGEGALVIATVGIIFFALSVVFALITLPVEFNASKRAIDLLESNHIIDSDEVPAVKEVLNAAALTYVASAAAAIATLLRLILIVRRRNN